VGAGASLWGNMALVVSLAFPRMVWRSIARPVTDAMVRCECYRVASRRYAPARWDKDSNIE
jgi:hypothetical protein